MRVCAGEKDFVTGLIGEEHLEAASEGEENLLVM